MIFAYDLQFFAKDGPGGEKTEPATEKRISDARKDGKVAKSKEVGNALTLLSFFLLLKYMSDYIGENLVDLFKVLYNRMPTDIIQYDGYFPYHTMDLIFNIAIVQMGKILLPIFLVSCLMAWLADFIQVRFMFSTKSIQPKLSNLSPMNGIRRLFSMTTIVELLKSVLKIVLIAYVIYSYMKGHINQIYLLYDMPLFQAIGLVGSMVIDLGIRISAFYIIIAFADYIYQKRKYNEDMKMTKQEVRDEYKDQEGDPTIKGKQRQRMQEASRRRMMKKLPEADVVITNPTHYAVAIKYDADLYDAPYVIAKGADYLAQKIKDSARENNIEIVENKPLARMLYANVEIGQVVPPELYQAVAEVLAFVYHLKEKT